MILNDEEALYARLSVLLSGQELDFVACPVISHWHAIGVDALAYSLARKRGGTPAGVVVILAHPRDGFVIEERDFACRDFASVEFWFMASDLDAKVSRLSAVERFLAGSLENLSAVWRMRFSWRRGGHDITIASVLNPNVKLLRIFRDPHLSGRYRPRFRVIDEGAGMHMSTRRVQLQRLLDRGGMPERSPAWGLLNRCEALLMNLSRAYRDLTERAMKAQYLFLFTFDRRRRRLSLNEAVAASYRAVIGMKRERATERVPSGHDSPLAVVLTQPFSEYGQISEADDLALLEEVIRVALKCGLDVGIKAHPREARGKYEGIPARFDPGRVSLLEQGVPVEALLVELSPACVIGYSSTALLVAKALYDIPAISVMEVLVKEAPTEYLKVTAADFGKLSTGFCVSAGSSAELKELLLSLRSSIAGSALTKEPKNG